MDDTQPTKAKGHSPKRKTKSKHKSEGSMHEEVGGSVHKSKSRNSQSVHERSPTSITHELEEFARRSRHTRRETETKKKVSKREKHKAPSPNAVAQASQLYVSSSPRSITPPNRTLSEKGLLEGKRSLDDEPRLTRSSHASCSIADLYKSHHSPIVVKKPLWMKESISMRRDSSITPTRQRAAPPPESPLAGSARFMQHQRKLERNSSHDGGLGMSEAVQRRRRKHFEKCSTAATQIQRMARGWLVRYSLRTNRSKSSRRKGHKHKDRTNKKERNKKEQQRSSNEQENQEMHRSLSPSRVCDAPAVEPSLTPLENAMRLSLRRLGASEKELNASSLGSSQRELMSSSYIRGSIRGTRSIDLDSDMDVSNNEEEELCNMFRSNIGQVTAKARRRSLVG